MTLLDIVEGQHYSFPEQELDILKFWNEIDAFGEQLRRTEGQPEFVFYDGPPFATGLPHYGHLLAGTIKVICYFTIIMCLRKILSGHRDTFRLNDWPPLRPPFRLGLSRITGGARN